MILTTNSYDIFLKEWEDFDNFLIFQKIQNELILLNELPSELVKLIFKFLFIYDRFYNLSDLFNLPLRPDSILRPVQNNTIYFKDYKFFDYFDITEYNYNLPKKSKIIIPEFKISITPLSLYKNNDKNENESKFQIVEICDTIGCLTRCDPITINNNNNKKKWWQSKFLIPNNSFFRILTQFLSLQNYDQCFPLLSFNSHIQKKFNPNNEIAWGSSDGQNNIWHFKRWVIQFFSYISFYFFSHKEELMYELNDKLKEMKWLKKTIQNTNRYKLELAKTEKLIDIIENQHIFSSFLSSFTLPTTTKKNNIDPRKKYYKYRKLDSFHDIVDDDGVSNIYQVSEKNMYPWKSNDLLDQQYEFSIKWRDYNSGMIYDTCLYKFCIFKRRRTQQSQSILMEYNEHRYNLRYRHFYISIKDNQDNKKYYYHRGSIIALNPITSLIFYWLSLDDQKLQKEIDNANIHILSYNFRRLLLQRITMIIDWN
jgi:hypothetical protein